MILKNCALSARGSKYFADSFCCVSDKFFAKRAENHCLNNCNCAGEAYLAYFGMPVGDQDKRWAPHLIWDYCRRTLEGWLRGEKRSMRFATLRIWREPSDHHTGCYFYVVDPIKRRKEKNAPPIEYPDIPPVPHNTTDGPVRQPPSKDQYCPGEARSEDSENEGASSSAFVMRRPRRLGNKRCPYYPNQEDINDLNREMTLAKSNAELLITSL